MSEAPVYSITPSEFAANPYPALAEMRAIAPVCYVPELDAYLLTRRDDIHLYEKQVDLLSSDRWIEDELAGKIAKTRVPATPEFGRGT